MRTRADVERKKKEIKRLEKLAMKCQGQRAKLTEQASKMRDDLLELQSCLANMIVSLNTFFMDEPKRWK